MIFLDFDDLLHVAARTLGGHVPSGTTGCSSRRWPVPGPASSARTPIRRLEDKAAALLHSLARNHALVDGDKRLALAATTAFLGLNDRRPTLSDDEAYDLIIAVAAGRIDDVGELAARFRDGSRAT